MLAADGPAHVRAPNALNEEHVKQIASCLFRNSGSLGSSSSPSPIQHTAAAAADLLASLELRVVPKPTRCASITPLYFDALTFSAEICPLNDWCIARMCTRAWMLVHGLRAFGFSPTVFIGAVSHTDSRWQRRREREMQRFERPMPQGFSALIGEAYRAAGVPVYYSVSHSNEDTLAAYAHLHDAAILSRDGCFLRYRDAATDAPASFIRTALLFRDYEVTDAPDAAAALPADGFALSDSVVSRMPPCRVKLVPHLARAPLRGDLPLPLDPLPLVRCEEGSLADAFSQRKYIRGCPSPLMRVLGADPHAATRPLRQALFRLMLEKRAEVALRAPSVFEEPPRKREARSAAAVETAAAGSRVIAAAVRSAAGLGGAGGAGTSAGVTASPTDAPVNDSAVAIAEKWPLWDCVADRACWYDSAAMETDLIVSLLHADPAPGAVPSPVAAPPVTPAASAPADAISVASSTSPVSTAGVAASPAFESADPEEADPSPPAVESHAEGSNASSGTAVGGAGTGDIAVDRMRQLLLGHPFDAMRELFPLEAACLRASAPADVAGLEGAVACAAMAASVSSSSPTTSTSAVVGVAADAEDPLVAAPSEPLSASASGTSLRSRHWGELPVLVFPAPVYSALPGTTLAHSCTASERVHAMPMPPAIQTALRKLDGSRQAEIKQELWYKHVFGCASTVAEVCAAATGKSYLSALIALGF